MSRGFRENDDEKLVLIRFDEIEHETEDAYLIGDGVWLPKSAVSEIDETEMAFEAWIPISLARKKGLDYE